MSFLFFFLLLIFDGTSNNDPTCGAELECCPAVACYRFVDYTCAYTIENGVQVVSYRDCDSEYCCASGGGTSGGSGSGSGSPCDPTAGMAWWVGCDPFAF